MEWLTCIKSSISYMEDHLLDIENMEEIANYVHISPLYLHKGFQIMTGYSISEYIRNRRLYEAACELIYGESKIIDIAYKYAYETPESFTKAFARFHGITPSELRKDRKPIRTFLPLKISILIQGGDNMDFTVEKMTGFQVIGFSREFSFEDSYKEIPKFWNEIYETYHPERLTDTSTLNEIEKTIFDNHIGNFGVCIDDIRMGNKFCYMIAGKYMGGNVPENMNVYDIPDMLWAKFKCVGPLPHSMQSVNTRIWKEWLPGNSLYELAGNYNLEWYSANGNTTDSDYQSEIWIPVKLHE